MSELPSKVMSNLNLKPKIKFTGEIYSSRSFTEIIVTIVKEFIEIIVTIVKEHL